MLHRVNTSQAPCISKTLACCVAGVHLDVYSRCCRCRIHLCILSRPGPDNIPCMASHAPSPRLARLLFCSKLPETPQTAPRTTFLKSPNKKYKRKQKAHDIGLGSLPFARPYSLLLLFRLEKRGEAPALLLTVRKQDAGASVFTFCWLKLVAGPHRSCILLWSNDSTLHRAGHLSQGSEMQL
jgi:hypothetical protein